MIRAKLSTTSTGREAVAATPTITYSYDLNSVGTGCTGFVGALSAVSSSAGKIEYSYDGFGRAAQSRQTTPLAGQAYTFTNYQYSLTDQLTGITYPSGRSIAYTLDAADQVTAVNGTPPGGATTPYASGIQHIAAGAVSSLPFGNGVTETRNWNNLLEQTSISAGSLLTLGYAYCSDGTSQCANNNTGSPFQHTMAVSGSTMAIQEYQHDALNRLSMASEHAGSSNFVLACPDSGSAWCRQFSYDNSGNRTVPARSPSGSNTWDAGSFSAKNQVADPGWTYDNAGNVTKSPMGQTMTYDGENRMVTFCSDASCTQRTQFFYDAAGNRVQRTDSNATSTATTTFVYDAFGNLAAEYGGTPGAAGTQYLTVDALGSARLVMAGTQASERHDFEPYGAELSLANGTLGPWRTVAMGYGTDTVRQKFTGQERDNESGLDYFLARYYSGVQGRFGSPDPGNAGANPGDPQSWNGYAYVSGNPLSFTDPSGMVQSSGGDSDIIGAIATAFGDAIGSLFGGGGSHPNLSNVAWTPTSTSDTSPALLSWSWFSPYSVTSINISFGDGLSIATSGDVALDSWEFHAVALGAQHAKKTVDYAGIGTAAVLSLPVLVSGAYAVPTIAARGVGYYMAVTGGSGVVIGNYPHYVDAARKIGANAFNLGERTYGLLEYFGEAGTANRTFLDVSLRMGQQVYLSSAPLGQAGSQFGMELQHLSTRGCGPQCWIMLAEPFAGK